MSRILQAGKAFLEFVRSGGERLPREERNRRLAICKACPKYRHGVCRICGCLVAIKTWLPSENCPRRYWEPKGEGCGHCGK